MRIAIIFLLITLLGCAQEPQDKEVVNLLDLPGLMDELAVNMDAKNHRITKSFILNSKVETKQYESSDSSFWRQELNKLHEIDLNSPQIRGGISVRRKIKDNNSNLLIDEYSIPDTKFTTLKILRIYYMADTSEIRQIYAELSSDNLIATSNTYINIWMNRYNNRLLIDSLQTKGKDKTLMQPAREYMITTHTIWE